MPMEIKIGKTTLRLVTGDIAEQDTDAVVTAAHWRLNKGMGTDGTIHSKGGPQIYEECKRIGGCPIGDAVITTGGNHDDPIKNWFRSLAFKGKIYNNSQLSIPKSDVSKVAFLG
jgi:hypothetical protein